MDPNVEDQESSTSTVLSEATETVDDGDNAQSKQQERFRIENNQFTELHHELYDFHSRQEFPAYSYLPAHEEANKVPRDLAMSAIKEQWLLKETKILPATKPIEPETVSEQDEDTEQEATNELPVVNEGTAVPLEVLMSRLDLTVTSTNPVTLTKSHFENVQQATAKLQHVVTEDISVQLEDPIVLTEFLERIRYSIVQIKITLKQNYLSVEKMLDEILETEAKTLQEITSMAILKSNLHSVACSKVRTITNTLEHLETCFNSKIIDQHLHGVSPKPSDLSQEGLGAESSGSCDPYLVTVSHVIDPGKFYVIRMCDSKISNAIVSTLKETASTYPVPEKIVPGKMYAVLNTGLNWYRGVCGKVCEQSQVDDKPEEIVYHFFLPDQGHHEHIPASSVRVLPFGLLNFPPTALECKLYYNYDRVSWSAESVASFKQMVTRSPMNMKVFKQEGGILEVDLAQLPCFGESNILSVRDALSFSYRPPCNEVTQKFKPKYGSHNLGLGHKVPKQLVVRVCYARSPINIYVHVLDEELLQFQLVHQEMQNEFYSATGESVPQPQKGFAYAVQNNRQWYRVLAEHIFVEKNKLSVFYVDIGLRQLVNNYECFKLPERFMEMPAQAVRCMLDGVHPLSKGSSQWNKSNRKHTWPREVREILRSCNEKKAVVFLEKFRSGEVGIGSANELTVWVVMYIDGEKSSVNDKLSRFNLTNSSKQHERPDHYLANRMGPVSKADFHLKALDELTASTDCRINAFSTNATAKSSTRSTLENSSPMLEQLNSDRDLRSRLSTTNSISFTESNERDSSFDDDEPSEEMSSMTEFFALADVVPPVPVDSPIFYQGVKKKHKSLSERARNAKRWNDYLERKKQ